MNAIEVFREVSTIKKVLNEVFEVPHEVVATVTGATTFKELARILNNDPVRFTEFLTEVEFRFDMVIPEEMVEMNRQIQGLYPVAA